MSVAGYVVVDDDVDREIKCCWKGSSDQVLQKMKIKDEESNNCSS